MQSIRFTPVSAKPFRHRWQLHKQGNIEDLKKLFVLLEITIYVTTNTVSIYYVTIIWVLMIGAGNTMIKNLNPILIRNKQLMTQYEECISGV